MLLGMAGQPAHRQGWRSEFLYQAIYARYSGAQGVPVLISSKGRARCVLTNTCFCLIKMSDVYEALTPQETSAPGRLISDPICSCQDPDGLRVESITVDPPKNRLVLTDLVGPIITLTHLTKTVRLTLVFTIRDGCGGFIDSRRCSPHLQRLAEVARSHQRRQSRKRCEGVEGTCCSSLPACTIGAGNLCLGQAHLLTDSPDKAGKFAC